MAQSDIQSWRSNLKGKVHPVAEQAFNLLFDAIQDHDTAIVAVNNKVTTPAAAASTTTPNSSSSSSTPSTPSTFPFPNLGIVNRQSGTAYATQLTDNGALLVVGNAGGVAVTLVSTVAAPWFMTAVNLGSTDAIFTPSSGAINNNPTLTVPPNGAAFIYFDGVNFWAPFTPSIPIATSSILGIVKPDNTTITISGGVITAVGGGGGGVTRGALNTNANGSWYVWSDGVIEQWGSVSIAPTSANLASGLITFPTPFTTSVQSFLPTISGLPRAASSEIAMVQGSAVPSLTSVGVNLQCSVPTGGGGVTFDQAVTVYWRAIGK